MIVFIHDNKVYESKRKLYSNGSLSAEIFNRHMLLSSDIIYVTRHANEELNTVIAEKKDLKWIPFKRKNFFYIINILRKAEVVILRVPSFLSIVYFPFIRRKSLLVEVVGCSWDTFWNHSLYGKLLAPALYIFQKMVVRNATYTHYVTQQFLQERYPTRARISLSQSDVVLSNDIDQKDHPPLEKKNPLLVIGSIGAYNSAYKDFETLFKAIRLVLETSNINLELQLVGGGNSNQLKRRAAKLGVLDSIVFKGSMAHEDVLSWLKSLDIYLHPSKAEGCPRSLIEALASKNTLCFGSDVGGIPELLPASALFPKGDFRRIAMFLESYLNRQWRLNSMTKQEKCFIVENFKPDVIRNNYLSFYNQVLSEL